MHYFYGPDTYAAREAIEAVAQQEAARIRWVDQEQLEGKSIGDIVGQSHGLFGKDVAVVRDPSDMPQLFQEDITAYVAREGTTVSWVLWDRGMPDKRSKLWRAVKARAQEFPHASPKQIVNWLVARAQHLGGEVELKAAEALVARIGFDRWRLENELQRLLLMAQGEGQGVGLALVEQEVAVSENAEIFATLDALVRGEQASALKSIETLLAAGHSEFYILSMLGYQFRTLVMIRAGLDEGKTPSSLARESKLHPYVVEKNVPVAQRLSLAVWRGGLTRILATDFAIKQGKVDPRTGLLMLIMTLRVTR